MPIHDERQPVSSRSLFDSVDVWRSDPVFAFEGFLQSPSFTATRRSAGPDVESGDGPPWVSEGVSVASAKVYKTMFSRYLEYLASARQAPAGEALMGAGSHDVHRFLGHELKSASRETLWRYVRLLERVHEHLVRQGWKAGNPVSLWAQTMASNGELKEFLRSRKAQRDDQVEAEKVDAIEAWASMQASRAMNPNSWRRARDFVLCTLSLSTGLRYTELAKLQRGQLERKSGAHAAATGPERSIELDIPRNASVATSRPHRVFVEGEAASLLDDWMRLRWSRESSIGRAPGELVFPATLTGKPMSTTLVYKNLKEIAAQAMASGILDNSSQWVLTSGAAGLRRAYVLRELARGREQDLLTERLGHWRRKSIRRYASSVA